ELWGIPTVASPTRSGITTIWHGLRFGYEFSRTLTLDGPSLVADYTLTNLAPFEFSFVWAPHALMAATVPLELDLPGQPLVRVDSAEAEVSPQTGRWPAVDESLDLSRIDALPPKRSWKAFTQEPIHTPLNVLYPSRRRRVRVEYSSEDELAACWGIWINTGGWAGQKHLAVEPTTGRFD